RLRAARGDRWGRVAGGAGRVRLLGAAGPGRLLGRHPLAAAGERGLEGAADAGCPRGAALRRLRLPAGRRPGAGRGAAAVRPGRLGGAAVRRPPPGVVRAAVPRHPAAGAVGPGLAAVGEIGFLRGTWLDGSRRLVWLERYAELQSAAADLPAPSRLERRISLTGVTNRKSTRLNSSHVKISYAVFC